MKKILLILFCLLSVYSIQAQAGTAQKSTESVYADSGCIGADGLLHLYFNSSMNSTYGSAIYVWIKPIGGFTWFGFYAPISVSPITGGLYEYVYAASFALDPDECYDVLVHNDRTIDPKSPDYFGYIQRYCPCPPQPCNAHFCYRVCTDAPNIVTFMPAETHLGSTYHWDWGNGTSSPYPQSVIYASGSYTICLTEIQRDGTRCEECMDLCVNEGSQGGHIPDGRKESNSGGLSGLDQPVQIYPNPASDMCTIRLFVDQPPKVQVRIIDMMGRVVMNMNSEPLDAGTREIKLSTLKLTSGTYSVEVMSGTQITTQKLAIIK